MELLFNNTHRLTKVTMLFRGARHNILCRAYYAKYNPDTSSYGYGGESGTIDQVFCRTGFTGVGKQCIIPTNQAESIQVVAAQTCAEINGATLYSPQDPVQNAIMATKMQDMVNPN